jgi:hypothetical protein
MFMRTIFSFFTNPLIFRKICEELLLYLNFLVLFIKVMLLETSIYAMEELVIVEIYGIISKLKILYILLNIDMSKLEGFKFL